MPTVRSKIDIQADRLEHERNGALAKAHPETIAPDANQLGVSAELSQMADIVPSEVEDSELRGPEDQGIAPDGVPLDLAPQQFAEPDVESFVGTEEDDSSSRRPVGND